MESILVERVSQGHAFRFYDPVLNLPKKNLKVGIPKSLKNKLDHILRLKTSNQWFEKEISQSQIVPINRKAPFTFNEFKTNPGIFKTLNERLLQLEIQTWEFSKATLKLSCYSYTADLGVSYIKIELLDKENQPLRSPHWVFLSEKGLRTIKMFANAAKGRGQIRNLESKEKGIPPIREQILFIKKHICDDVKIMTKRVSFILGYKMGIKGKLYPSIRMKYKIFIVTEDNQWFNICPKSSNRLKETFFNKENHISENIIKSNIFKLWRIKKFNFDKARIVSYTLVKYDNTKRTSILIEDSKISYAKDIIQTKIGNKIYSNSQSRKHDRHVSFTDINRFIGCVNNTGEAPKQPLINKKDKENYENNSNNNNDPALNNNNNNDTQLSTLPTEHRVIFNTKRWGYKIAKCMFQGESKSCLVKLYIPVESKVVNADQETKKMRCNFARVIGIFPIVVSKTTEKGKFYSTDVELKNETLLEYKLTAEVTEATPSVYTSEFKYRLGEWVSVTNFDPDPNILCAPGIHFFSTPSYSFEFLENTGKIDYVLNPSLVENWDENQMDIVVARANAPKKTSSWSWF